MDHNHNKALFRLLLLLLTFSLVFSRNLKATSWDRDSLSIDPELHKQFVTDKHLSRVLLEEKEEASFIEGRMDIERLDYSGTGANNHHDPKPPGSF